MGLCARLLAWVWLGLAPLSTGCGRRDSQDPQPVRVAVASNFASTFAELARGFEETSGLTIESSSGSTGKLRAQVENGAPFDVFLAADESTPEQLERSSLAVAGTRFSYAIGRLALYGPGLGDDDDGARSLRRPDVGQVAIANPDTAPYGRAARETLEHLGLWSSLGPRVARAENVVQAQQFVDSGSAELGLVALSGVRSRAKFHHWVVPANLHAPIRQVAVLLTRGEQNGSARAFVDYLGSAPARRIIERDGYLTVQP